MQNPIQDIQQNKDSNSEFNIKEEVFKYLQYWKWIIVCILISLFVVYINLRYTNNIFSTSSKIKIIDPSGGLELPTQSFVFKRSNINLEDNMQILTSYPILEKVVEKLNLEVQFYVRGRLLVKEIAQLPLNFVKKNSNVLRTGKYNVKLLKDGIEIYKNDILIESFDSHNTTLKDHSLDFDLIPFENSSIKNIDDQEFDIIIGTKENKVTSLKSRIKIAIIGANSNLLGITLSGQSKILSERIINTLMEVFIEDGILDRQRISQSTIDFINDRFKVLAKELDTVENENKEFKESRRITSIEADAMTNKAILDETDRNLNSIKLQIQLANQLKSNLFRTDADNQLQILPNVPIEDLQINNSIQIYNTNLNEYKAKIQQGAGVENPVVKNILNQISDSKENILKSIDSYINDLNTKQTLSLNLKNQFDGKISSIPGDEKVLRSIQRQQKIKESLYILLLQKREEAYINKAITEPSAKIIEFAISNNAPISPKPNILYLGAILIGLAIPVSIIFLIYFLDSKIHYREDLEKIAPNIPIVAEIPFIKNKNETLFLNPSDRTVLSEAFRILSSNVNFLFPTKLKNQCKVIFSTSTSKGEGKTFVSLNMSIAFSTFNNKVLLIGADLRNPQIHNYINVKKDAKGLSDYLYDQENDWKSNLIQGFKNHPSHHILLSGSIPPNPTHLLSNGRFEKLIEEAKNDYDYIIVDTAPTILVTDTMMISQCADVTVYITRSGFTERKIINHSISLNETKKLKNIAYVINGIGQSNKYAYRYQYGYGYKYGYNYGYGYGYGSEK